MKETMKMTPAEAKEAADAEAYNRKQTGGYDQTKGPEGKGEHKTKAETAVVTDDELRKSLQDVVKGWKGRVDKDRVTGMLRTVAELLFRDESWVRSRDTLDYDPDDLDDPRANPQGIRPSPATATRADEHTAPEPDSMGNIGDRLAAKAGLEDDDIDVSDVPPVDRDAVRAKRLAQKSVDQFGTAGGSPLARAEHKDDPKPKK